MWATVKKEMTVNAIQHFFSSLFSRLISKIIHFPEWCIDKVRMWKRSAHLKHLHEIATIGRYFCERQYNRMEGYHCVIHNINTKNAVRIGDYVKINGTLCCNKNGQIEIGDHTVIREDAFISSDNKVTIGKYCFISKEVYIYDNNGHPILPELRQVQSENLHAVSIDTYDSDNSPVVVENNVTIGIRSIILKGVTIGKGSYIGAGSVVVKDVPAGTIAAGNPAKVVKKISDDS
jgi:acetyltransferase-like isoleucine patch superfamily enzyme